MKSNAFSLSFPAQRRLPHAWEWLSMLPEVGPILRVHALSSSTRTARGNYSVVLPGISS
jgi:hypothetical protein